MESPEYEQKISDLEAQNLKLKKQLQQLKMHPPALIREKQVPPPDYEDIKKANKALEKQNRRYKQMFSMGHISDLSLLISKFIESSKVDFQKIASEIELTDYNQHQVTEILALVDYLKSACDDFYALISVSEEGRFINNPPFRRIVFNEQIIRKFFAKKSVFLKYDAKTLGRLHQILLAFIQKLKDFEEDPEGRLSFDAIPLRKEETLCKTSEKD